MTKIKIFIELTRLNKPIGFMLLFWPCLWGLTLAFNQTKEFKLFVNYIILFFLGSVLMRSAGCIFNDIVDKNFDKKVDRTKNRPIPSGRISIQESFVYIILLCFIALIILIQFNFLTIVLGLLSIPFAFSYPYMKRLTYWPQLFLGLTFNWGILMGWTAFIGEISLEPILLYIAAIFWTLGYDTIYGFQDINNDEIIGVKSTSIKFKENYKIFIGLCYFICILFLIAVGFLEENKIYYFTFLIFPATHLFYQVIRLDRNDPNNCLIAFKSNNFFGFLFFLTLIVVNI
jgi:4-hydroxybenzoate polyprenyl transferase